MERYDYITIGGGSGGISSANRAAEYGKKVLIVEADQVGGTCVNRGCVPKKIMWHAGKMVQENQDYAPSYGLDYQFNGLDYQTLIANRDAYIDRVHNSYFSGFESRGTHYLQGRAKFIDNHTIEVNGEKIHGDHITIAVGGRPLMLNIPGIELADSSDEFFKWESLPESVVLIGAGYIGVEFAMMLNEFGVDTSVILREDTPMFQLDPEITKVLRQEMEQAGIKIYAERNVNKLDKGEDGLINVYVAESDDFISAEKVIMAVGRRPNTDDLGLENTDVQLTDSGHIKVDDYHFTDAEGVYAIGDVLGKVDLTPVAIKAGRTLADHLFNGADKFYLDYNKIASNIFANPPIITMGYTEKAAIDKFGADQIASYQSNFTAMFTAVTDNRQPVTMKLVCQGPNEVVIGIHGIGYGLEEMLQGFAVAVQAGLTKADFDATVAIHPTAAEDFVTMR
ncbi:glutathione reductase [Aerococcus urinaehominis]|uniref:Glutathione reductase n=1 Tax=Aerococcus urinaehominis TaxID=128944 RepID=A0A120IAQ0_9LACT|nr:glutathione-disulfide reductase [Aerococcus urinaehominis]AMB98754.1 glutathione reductase [Aerococcus urinaehominis]SDM14009.1 NADPH-glutathione reductase [Aerococcus urinaehominis]